MKPIAAQVETHRLKEIDLRKTVRFGDMGELPVRHDPVYSDSLARPSFSLLSASSLPSSAAISIAPPGVTA